MQTRDNHNMTAIEDFPAGAGPYLAGIEGYFEKVQDNRQVRNLMREEPDSIISPCINDRGAQRTVYL
jgi:hypothetical protein